MDEALAHVLAEVEPVARWFEASRFRVYLVGGIVRDLVVGRHLDAADIDLTTDATPDEVVGLLDPHADFIWKQGARFGTIGARFGERTYEITTHRSESYLVDSRKPVVKYSSRVEDDLARRDFTINAMAISIPDGTLVDPFGGQADLAARVLRTPLSPDVSFSEDPLRMLRAARFAAGYGLTVPDDIEAALTRLRSRMSIVSRERVRDELDKVLAVADPLDGLRLLQRVRLFDEFAPELQEPAAAAVFPAITLLDGLCRRRAALFVAIADPRAMIERARALKYSNTDLDHLRSVRRGVDRLRELPTVDDANARRFMHEFGDHLDDIFAIAGVTEIPAAPAMADAVARLAATEAGVPLAPPLDGNDVAALLGIEAGPTIGEALAFLLRLRLDEGPIAPDVARRRLLDWWAGRKDS